MMQNAYLKLLNDRLALHLNDDIGLMENWKEQTTLLSSNIGDSISFILNDITDDQFVWMSEVFEDVAEQSQSQDFVDAIRARALRIKSKEDRESVLSEVEYASNRLLT